MKTYLYAILAIVFCSTILSCEADSITDNSDQIQQLEEEAIRGRGRGRGAQGTIGNGGD